MGRTSHFNVPGFDPSDYLKWEMFRSEQAVSIQDQEFKNRVLSSAFKNRFKK